MNNKYHDYDIAKELESYSPGTYVSSQILLCGITIHFFIEKAKTLRVLIPNTTNRSDDSPSVARVQREASIVIKEAQHKLGCSRTIPTYFNQLSDRRASCLK